MTRGTLLRITAAAILAALLLTPPAAHAQGRPASPAREEGGGFFAAAWSFLIHLLPGGEALDTRCTIDPNGGVSCPGSGPMRDNRCTIDPDGGISCPGSPARVNKPPHPPRIIAREDGQGAERGVV
jgi:hypothetical protein